MQDGNQGQDPVCGRCKQQIDGAGRTEAVYQDGIWFHIACHRAGADQLFRATRLSEVLKEAKRGWRGSPRRCSRGMICLDGTRSRGRGVLADALTGLEHTVSGTAQVHERGEGAER